MRPRPVSLSNHFTARASPATRCPSVPAPARAQPHGIRGDVEIVYVEIGGEVRQLPLSAGLDVDEPEILCWISPRRSTSVRPRHEDQAPSPASEGNVGNGCDIQEVVGPNRGTFTRRASGTGLCTQTLIRSGGRRRGAPPRAIQELAGQRKLGMAQRFMHLSPVAFTCDSAARSTGHHARTLETGRVGRTEDQWIKWR